MSRALAIPTAVLTVAALLASALLTIVAALVPSWHGFLALRALTGLTASGLPAVAMAYVGEEMHPRSIGLAMGLYIGGSALGGLFWSDGGWPGVVVLVGSLLVLPFVVALRLAALPLRQA